jgi:regulator of RNase E activity RraA
MTTASTPSVFARASTASLTAQLIKRGLRTRAISNIRPVNPATPRVWGPAYTLRYIPMREDLGTGASMASPANPQRMAIEVAPPGSVIVADTRGMDASGTFGDILVARLRVRGVAGIVSDGPMRDISELGRMDFPVFATGNAAPPSYGSMLAVDAQVPIGCGGVAVFPDDVVVVDDDGAVLIPQALVEAVAQEGTEQERLEGWIMSEVERGVPLPGLYPPNDDAKARYAATKK